MKRLILAVFMALMAFPAYAGWNLRQNDDGTTSWVREYDGAQRTHDVGTVYLQVLVENIGGASTGYVAVPVTGYRIKQIDSVLYGPIATADAPFAIAILASDGTKVQDVTNGTSPHTITQSGSAAGDIDTFTPTDAAANYIEASQSIRIDTSGEAANDVDAMFTIQLVPR